MSSRQVAVKSVLSITKDRIFMKEICQTLMYQFFNNFREEKIDIARENRYRAVMWLDRRRVPGSDKQKKNKLKTHSLVY